jgi:hypothetical protein
MEGNGMRDISKFTVLGALGILALAGCKQETNYPVEVTSTEAITTVVPVSGPTNTVIVPVPGPTSTVTATAQPVPSEEASPKP